MSLKLFSEQTQDNREFISKLQLVRDIKIILITAHNPKIFAWTQNLRICKSRHLHPPRYKNMSPNPTDDSVVIVEQNDDRSKNYICVFSDETNLSKTSKSHQNVNGNTTVRLLYELVAKKLNYKLGSFLLSYLEFEDRHSEILIDINCEDTLNDLLKDSKFKKSDFIVKRKDYKDPISTLLSEETTSAVQQTSEAPETYAASFFKLDGNNDETKHAVESSDAYTVQSSTSFTFSNSSQSSIKSGTGFVGLVNQAMTCYLNSLLQTLFMTPEFRNGLYRWRFKGTTKEETTSIPFQLQKLFLKLETSNKRAVETTGLTKSFGWESGEAWQQHDVQELCRVMFDKLEETLKDTDQEHLINQLYQGEMKDYVKCLKCGHENSRHDNYLDISVDIRPFGSKEPHKNLEEALKAFVTPETLDGNNQYACQNCKSLQDAHKGLKFLTFPYLLTIQLKRFTFDFKTLQRIKLPDKLTFPFHVDLNKLVDKSKSKTTEEDNGNTEDIDNKCPNDEDIDNKYPNDEEIAPKIDEKLNDEVKDEKTTETINSENHVDDNCSKDPFMYELFSILIHSGSAIGGHYYAYIKSFENQKWYCFNDQYVTEISEEEIKKSYGGDDRVGSGFTSNFSSSTSAYMLMYRKIDPSLTKSFVKQSEWSTSLKDLCKNILRDEHNEHNRKEWEKNICKVNLYAFHPFTKVKLNAKLEVHKDATFKEATTIAWEALELQDIVPLSQCRLVKYDDYNGSFDKSYEDSEDKPMIELLGAVRQTYGFDYLLECRKKDEKFSVYLPGGTTLKVYLIDLEEIEFDEPRIFHIPLTCTIGDLKLHLEKEIGLSAETMRVAMYKEYHDFNLLDKDTRTLKTEGFYKSAKIFVEGLSEEDGNLEFKKSKFYQRLDVFNHSINLRMILPFVKEGTDKKEELLIMVDKRITLNELKEQISKHTKLSPEMFRLYRTYSNNQEFECTRLDDQLNAYSDETKIIVKLGRALKHGETRIKIYQLLINEKEHIKFLMDGIVNNKMSIKTMKEEQVIPEFQKQGITVTTSRCRIRKKSYKNPTIIYHDHYLFEEHKILGYSTELFVELLENGLKSDFGWIDVLERKGLNVKKKYDDRVITDEDISLYVKQWHPESYVLDPFQEVVLSKKIAVVELKKEIENISHVPAEFIHIARSNGMFPYSCSVLDIHHELSWDPVVQNINENPIGIKDDGNVIYYRDSRETLKKLTDDERKSIRNKEREKSAESSTNKIYRKEKALKIYTNGEKR